MLSVLLDTHVLVWWRLDPGKLSKAQSQTLLELEKRGRPAGISAITLRELAKMVEQGRQKITRSLDMWLQETEEHPLLTVLPITARIAAESVRLGDDFPRDPADQIIVATARCHGLRLLTGDQRILRWGKVPVI